MIECLGMIALAALIGGFVGHMRATEQAEIAMRLLHIEWQSTLRTLTKDKDARKDDPPDADEPD